MNCNHQAIMQIISKAVGHKISAIKLGVGSFLTIDFGTLHVENRTYKNATREYIRGELQLWVYMCAWRIDKNDKPYVASSDGRVKIARLIKELAGATLTKCEILNASLDTIWYFDAHLTLTLFNMNTDDAEQWFLFMPKKVGHFARPCMVLTIGPGNI